MQTHVSVQGGKQSLPLKENHIRAIKGTSRHSSAVNGLLFYLPVIRRIQQIPSRAPAVVTEEGYACVGYPPKVAPHSGERQRPAVHSVLEPAPRQPPGRGELDSHRCLLSYALSARLLSASQKPESHKLCKPPSFPEYENSSVSQYQACQEKARFLM